MEVAQWGKRMSGSGDNVETGHNGTEVAALCRELIRIDTTNTGDNQTCAGERGAAESGAGLLDEVGLTPVVYEAEPGRTSVVARFEAAPPPSGQPAREALLVHAHLDVVPAEADQWSVHPFSGEVR